MSTELPKIPGAPSAPKSPGPGSSRRGKPAAETPGKKPAGKGGKGPQVDRGPGPLLREEELFRSALEGQEATELGSLMSQYNASSLRNIEDSLRKSAGVGSTLSGSAASTSKQLKEVGVTTKEIAALVAAVKTEVRTHINLTESSEHQRLTELEIENAMLKQELTNNKEEVQRQSAIIQGLRDTLSRRMIRTQVENEIIKSEVKHAIGDAQLDIKAMQRQLHESIETCVLKYQNREYATALKTLQDLSEEARQKVITQSTTLHGLIDAVGANDPMEEAKTMHTNLPPLYKKQLEYYSKEQLLSLVDIFSFEEGIVEIVGKSLYATDPLKTQQVMTT